MRLMRFSNPAEVRRLMTEDHGSMVVGALTGALVALTLATDRPRAAQRAANPTVSQLLAAAGRYIAGYEISFGAVVAEERYHQSTNDSARATNPAGGPTRRNTIGEVLFFNSGGAGWMAFHDVHVLDNAVLPVAPGRLAALAAAPTPEALAEAMRATATSATSLISTVPRAPAIPSAAPGTIVLAWPCSPDRSSCHSGCSTRCSLNAIWWRRFPMGALTW